MNQPVTRDRTGEARDVPQREAQLQADARTRTGDPFITSEVLYQLSYVGAAWKARFEYSPVSPESQIVRLRPGVCSSGVPARDSRSVRAPIGDVSLSLPARHRPVPKQPSGLSTDSGSSLKEGRAGGFSAPDVRESARPLIDLEAGPGITPPWRVGRFLAAGRPGWRSAPALRGRCPRACR